METGEYILPDTFKDLFSRFDKDGNGFIEKTEMIEFVHNNFQEMQKQSDQRKNN